MPRCARRASTSLNLRRFIGPVCQTQPQLDSTSAAQKPQQRTTKVQLSGSERQTTLTLTFFSLTHDATRRNALPRILITMCCLCLALVSFSSCAPRTQITTDWRAPETTPTPFTKVVAIAMSQDEILRRVAEDEFVRRLPDNTEGVAGYTLIPESERGDVEKVKARLRDAGVDGAAVFRLVGRDDQVVYSPGSVNYSFYGYYGWAQPVVYQTGYLRTETTVRIESNVYSVADEKLVWSGYSETIDPDSARTVIGDVTRLVARRLQRVGWVR